MPKYYTKSGNIIHNNEAYARTGAPMFDYKGNDINKTNTIYKANLSSICESCHNKLHEMNLVYTKKKTTDGYMLTLKRDD